MTFKRYIAASIDFVIIPDFILILFFLQFQSSLSRLSGLITWLSKLNLQKRNKILLSGIHYPHINDGIISILALRIPLLTNDMYTY